MPLITQRDEACNATGFLPHHAEKCEIVAQETQSVIMFRAPGTLASGLIADNYSLKGFRIHTKSCDWGPMAGFVCMDPRFTKSQKFTAQNRGWTDEALSGHIDKSSFGNINDSNWNANAMPIVISHDRIKELENKNIIRLKYDGFFIHGISSPKDNNNFTFPWILIPIDTLSIMHPWMKSKDSRKIYYILCIDDRIKWFKFRIDQILPPNVKTIPFTTEVTTSPIFGEKKKFSTVLGLCNPESSARGFKACVTADYDLFCLWSRPGNMAARRHTLMGNILHRTSEGDAFAGKIPLVDSMLPGNVHRMNDIDYQLEAHGLLQHHRFGNVSARIMLIKTLLNSAIHDNDDSRGNIIHHGDEAGNTANNAPFSSFFPIIAFIPWRNSGITRLIENNDEMAYIYKTLVHDGYLPPFKDAWKTELGV